MKCNKMLGCSDKVNFESDYDYDDNNNINSDNDKNHQKLVVPSVMLCWNDNTTLRGNMHFFEAKLRCVTTRHCDASRRGTAPRHDASQR